MAYDMDGFYNQLMLHDWVHTKVESSHCGSHANPMIADTTP